MREIKFAQDGEAMTISGYGAVFGNVDAYGDVITPGAFAKSLAAHKEAGTSPLMLLEHGDAPLPIGVWEGMAEDGHGLQVKGRFLDTSLGIDAWKAAKAGWECKAHDQTLGPAAAVDRFRSVLPVAHGHPRPVDSR